MKKIEVKEILCGKFRKTTGIEILGGNMYLSTEGIDVEYFQINLVQVTMRQNQNFIYI